MNGALLVVVGAMCFAAAYRFYGRYLERLFGIDAGRITPACARTDGVDYVPTRPAVLFGHHFASIAGAGPIVGPVAAAYLGWVPVALWIIVGCIFIGAMHDFAALFLSVRHEGRSIGSVIEEHLGIGGRLSFLVFCWLALILVVGVFASLVAKTFVATPAVATASLVFIVMAPLFGLLVYKAQVPLVGASLVFVPLLFVGVWFGTRFPLDLVAVGACANAVVAERVWLVILLIYAAMASVLPVWLLLQPRDYLNSFLLYAMIAAGFVGIVVAVPQFEMPAFSGWAAANPAGTVVSLFPILYVTVACGACSGFHALVASGTTAKQLGSERHIRPIGYGSMLVEGLVALMALCSVAVLTRDSYGAMLSEGTAVSAFAVGLASFTSKLGLKASVGVTFFALTISAFMLTTLDTATRLTRFAWQELFLPGAAKRATQRGAWHRVVSHPVVATLIGVSVAWLLSRRGGVWQIWPVFGASNQLLAALTLLVVTLVLVKRRCNFWVALVPMLFMSVITVWALWLLLWRNLVSDDGQPILVVATALLLLLALGLGCTSVWSLRREGRRT